MKKITKKAIKEFVKQSENLYYGFYFGDEKRTGELDDAINMLLTIDCLWHDLTADLDCWYEGNKIICEAIGETVMYWDTDIVDQLSFIEDLENLALEFYEKNKCTKAK
jgi:hypothetical protein